MRLVPGIFFFRGIPIGNNTQNSLTAFNVVIGCLMLNILNLKLTKGRPTCNYNHVPLFDEYTIWWSLLYFSTITMLSSKRHIPKPL